MKNLCLSILIIATSISCNSQHVRSDLQGKPLVGDDFTIIYNGTVLPCFMVEEDVYKYYKIEQSVFSKDLIRSYAIPGLYQDNQRLDNISYSTKDVRIIYVPMFLTEKEKYNSYLHIIGKNAKTIRGLTVGDSIDEVFRAYGENEFANERKDAWYTRFIGFGYEYYGNYADTGLEYPFFDEIVFSCDKGKVVAINYYKKVSNAK